MDEATGIVVAGFMGTVVRREKGSTMRRAMGRVMGTVLTRRPALVPLLCFAFPGGLFVSVGACAGVEGRRGLA